jgi:hypothetical protein
VIIRLLQGPALLNQIVGWSEDFPEGDDTPLPFMDAVGSVLLSYVHDLLLPEEQNATAYSLGPEAQLPIVVGVPRDEGVKGAFSITIQTFDGEVLATSDPTFLNDAHGRLVATDIPPELLDGDALQVLNAFAEAGFDVDLLARYREADVEELWGELVAATEELGAASVEEAAIVAQITTPESAGERVPA